MKEKMQIPQQMQPHKVIWWLLNRVDSDYVTFLVGFVSSVVISEFYELFQQEFVIVGWEKFWLLLGGTVLLGAATFLLLGFTNRFARLQRQVSNLGTEAAVCGYLEESWAEVGPVVRRMNHELIAAGALCIAYLLLNVLKFILNNCMV